MPLSRDTRAEIRAGLGDSWVVGLGLVPLGLAFGLLMTQASFAWWWTPVFSMVILAGSMEFLAIDMVLTGVGALSSALTAFMVNFRHIFYGLTFPRHILPRGMSRWYSTYALTDEAYAVASTQQAKGELSAPRLLTIQGFIHSMWILAGIVGAVVGYILPPDLEGMEFALTALFAVLALESFHAARDYSALLIAAVLALVAAAVLPGQMLMVALIAYFLVLLARVFSPKLDAALTWRRR